MSSIARHFRDTARDLSRDLTGGAVTSVVSLVYSLSFAALIFSGSIAGGLSQGISALLVGTAITALVIAHRSAFHFAVSGPDSSACAVMASMAAAIASDLSRTTSPEAAISNILYMLALATLITGVLLTLLGAARAGRWIRFIPYPVVGGLIAAAGVLTILGALRVMAGAGDAATGSGAVLALQYLAGIAWGALLLVALARLKQAMTLPLLILFSLILFHALLAASGTPVARARELGWLFQAPADTSIWLPWSLDALKSTQWPLLLAHAGDIGTLVLVTTLTVLINATGLEMETRTDANLDRELVLQGGANILSPLCGGFLGYLSMNRSLINYRLGGTRRLSGLAFALVTIAFALAGMGLVGYMPRTLLGGLLLYLGVSLAWKWAIASRRQLSLPDYLTLLLILVVTVTFSFGHGLVVGVLSGCVMFAFNYSKLPVIKFSFSGREYRSSHERSTEDKALLNRHGSDIRIYVLQGFIFFGMSDRLYRAVLESALPPSGHKARLLVLDMKLVHGVDASAIASFKKISYAARSAGASLVICGMSGEQIAEWRASGDADLQTVLHFADLDAAAEWCETSLLQKYRSHHELSQETIRNWLLAEVGDCADAVLAHLRRLALGPGEQLCRQGDPADEMYFIESGRVAIELMLPDGTLRRLRTLGPKTLLGEMGLYRDSLRSANVLVQEDSVVYLLSAGSLQKLQAADPRAAALFHAMVVRTVADRLEFSNAFVAALQR